MNPVSLATKPPTSHQIFIFTQSGASVFQQVYWFMTAIYSFSRSSHGGSRAPDNLRTSSSHDCTESFSTATLWGSSEEVLEMPALKAFQWQKLGMGIIKSTRFQWFISGVSNAGNPPTQVRRVTHRLWRFLADKLTLMVFFLMKYPTLPYPLCSFQVTRVYRHHSSVLSTFKKEGDFHRAWSSYLGCASTSCQSQTAQSTFFSWHNTVKHSHDFSLKKFLYFSGTFGRDEVAGTQNSLHVFNMTLDCHLGKSSQIHSASISVSF